MDLSSTEPLGGPLYNCSQHCFHVAQFSCTHLSTSSRVTMSFFFKALMAYSFPVFLNSASRTWTETKQLRTNTKRPSFDDLKGKKTLLNFMLPSQSVLCPELKYICSRPSASLWEKTKKENKGLASLFIFTVYKIRSVLMCTLEQTQADLHSLLCCLWMTANKDKVGHFTIQSHLSFTGYICPNINTSLNCLLVFFSPPQLEFFSL